MNIAMISYNTFVGGVPNGTQTRGSNSVFLLQNETGEKWGAGKIMGLADLDLTKAACEEQIDRLWLQLVTELPTIEKVVFYVGAGGGERAIELAAQNGLTPDRAIFVLCDCNLEKKKAIINSSGFSSSEIILCECGGHETMRMIYQAALEHGRI